MSLYYYDTYYVSETYYEEEAPVYEEVPRETYEREEPTPKI